MNFNSALLALHKPEVDDIVARVTTCPIAGNCCVFGLDDVARKVVVDNVIEELRSQENVRLLDVKIDRTPDPAQDVRCDFVDECTQQISSQDDIVEGDFIRKLDRMKKVLQRDYAEDGLSTVICIRKFENVRLIPGERLKGFFYQLLKLHESKDVGRPAMLLESSRAIDLLKVFCPDVYETTDFEIAFGHDCHKWIKPLSNSTLKALLLKLKVKHGEKAVSDIFDKTFGISYLVEKVLLGEADDVYRASVDQVVQRIVRMFKDVPLLATGCAADNWYDALLAMKQGADLPWRVKKLFKDYGLVDSDGKVPAMLCVQGETKNGSGVMRCDASIGETDSHYIMHTFPPSSVASYANDEWMHAGRFLIKKDWTEIRLFHDRARNECWRIISPRSRSGRGEKTQSDNSKGIALLSYFMWKYYQCLGKQTPSSYYERAQTKKCGQQSKSEWRKYLVSSPGLREFFKSQMRPTKGKKDTPCWGIMPDDEWVRRLDGIE